MDNCAICWFYYMTLLISLLSANRGLLSHNSMKSSNSSNVMQLVIKLTVIFIQ